MTTLLILVCIPAFVALLIIFGISLNDIDPWAGQRVPSALIGMASLAAFCILLYFASSYVLTGGF